MPQGSKKEFIKKFFLITKKGSAENIILIYKDIKLFIKDLRTYLTNRFIAFAEKVFFGKGVLN